LERFSTELDAQRMLFRSLDISRTVRRVEAKYCNSGRGRPRYPVRAMLLALMLMYLLQIPSVSMLSIQLCRHEEYALLCGFEGKTPDRTTFSKFIKRAGPRTIEGVFRELRSQALKMGLYGSENVNLSMDSTFIRAYSRRKRKAGVSDRGARVGKVERTTYALGWRVHTVASQERLPLTYIVRQANVNDKVPAPRLLIEAVRLLQRAGLSIKLLIADAQYYWTELFKLSRWLGIKPVIPAPPQIRKPIINLRVKHGFVVEGDHKLVRLYHHGRMMVEHVFKHGKERLNLNNLRWRGAAKVRMHVALCYSVIIAAAITAHKMGRPELAHSIKAFQ
jgi:transposase